MRAVRRHRSRKPGLSSRIDHSSAPWCSRWRNWVGPRIGGEAEDDRSASLTDRELRLLPFLQTYLTLGEIGDRLGVSPNTVKTQAGSIYSKLGATTRSEAVESAVARGLLPPLDILAARPSGT